MIQTVTEKKVLFKVCQKLWVENNMNIFPTTISFFSSLHLLHLMGISCISFVLNLFWTFENFTISWSHCFEQHRCTKHVGYDIRWSEIIMDKKFCSVDTEYIKSDLNDRDNTMKLLMRYENVKVMSKKMNFTQRYFIAKYNLEQYRK